MVNCLKNKRVIMLICSLFIFNSIWIGLPIKKEVHGDLVSSLEIIDSPYTEKVSDESVVHNESEVLATSLESLSLNLDVIGGTATVTTTPDTIIATGDTITVNISEVENGKLFKSIIVKDPDENEIDITEVIVGEEYTFEMPDQSVTIRIELEADTFTLTYVAGEYGSIEGEISQTINNGDDGTEVSAVPNEGYRFVEWSDGSRVNPRTDTNVSEDLYVTASFESWVTTTFIMSSGEIKSMHLGNDLLRRNTNAKLVNPDSDTLRTGEYEYLYIAQEFIPFISGTYSFGNSKAPIDTVIIVYENEFNPEQPAENFLGFNDDFYNPADGQVEAEVPVDAFCSPSTQSANTARNRCPAVELELIADTSYIIVTSTYRHIAHQNYGDPLDFPLTFFVSGPATVSDGSENRGSGVGGGGSSSVSPVVEQITVPVETGIIGEERMVAQTPIQRTREVGGRVTDHVVFEIDRVKKSVKNVKEAEQDTARIVIPDVNDEVSEVKVNIPRESTNELGNTNVNLEIFTENVRIEVPQQSMYNFENDLYFNITPLKDEIQKREVETRAKGEQLVKAVAKDENVKVVSRPMTIETNMQSRPVTLVLPLRDVQLPTSALERAKFLNELVIFIEHSDGEKRLAKGMVVDYKEGQLGLEFGVNKFSTFTILHLEGFEGYHGAYVNGYEDGTFKPNHSVTRAEIAAMIARNIGYEGRGVGSEAPFVDVAPTQWAAGFIEFVKQHDLMKGDNTGKFNPNAAISRAEMAAIVARYKKLVLPTDAESNKAFPDIAGHWAMKEIAANKEVGILSGYEDGTFRPNGNLTRAESVKVINHMFERGPLYGVTTPTFKDVPIAHWAFYEVEAASQSYFLTPRYEDGEYVVK